MEGLFCLCREGNKNTYYVFNEFIIKNILSNNSKRREKNGL